MNQNRTLLDLARRGLRHRTTASLLILGLLLGQFALYIHHLEHGLHGDASSCSLCLIGDHVGTAPPTSISLAVTATSEDVVPHYVLPTAPQRELHAFSARAPPRLFPV